MPPTAFQGFDQQFGQQPLGVGSYWIHDRDHESLPVLVCDIDMVTKYFDECPGYTLQPHGSSSAVALNMWGERLYPCLYLLDLRWFAHQLRFLRHVG